MRKVAYWEFHKALRSPVFLVMTIVVPLIMVITAGASYLLQAGDRTQTVDIAVVAASAQLFQRMEQELSSGPVSFTHLDMTEEEAKQTIRDGNFDGLVVLDYDRVLAGAIEYHVRDVRTTTDNTLRTVLAPWLTVYRLQELGLGMDQIQAAINPVRIRTASLTEQPMDAASFMAPIAAALVLAISTILSGQILMYGVIKEKRNRIVEILLSSISSRQLMLGKVLGYGALSLIQVLLWIGAGLAVASRFYDVGGILKSTNTLGALLAFFILGYLFLASFFAAVGATMKDAESGSQAQGLVVMIPMIPLFFASLIMLTPHAIWVRVLSHLPPFIPITMLLRLALSDVPLWELGTSLTALTLSIWAMVRLGARIFEGGILQYERSFGFKDLKRLVWG